MVTPNPSPISYQTFVVILIFYSVAVYYAVKYFSKNKNEDHAENI
jgi:hypothetical protein